MTRIQEAIGLGLVLGVIHGLVQSAGAVPVVPNFTQGSMTSHTETTSKQTETINSIDYATGWQYSVSGTNVNNNGASLLPPTVTEQCERDSNRRNRRTSRKLHNWTRLLQLQLHHNKSRGSIPVHPDLHGSRNDKPNSDPKNNRSYQRNRYYKYLYPVIGLLIASPVSAADVGGVSATANPIANSSGSVTNQAIQVLQGPYITNTYGGGISCQGPTANFTPYITHAKNDKDPFETFYMEPQYDNRDFEGRLVEVQKNVKNWPMGRVV